MFQRSLHSSHTEVLTPLIAYILVIAVWCFPCQPHPASASASAAAFVHPMFNYITTKGAARVTSMFGDDESVVTSNDSTTDEMDARMLNAIFSASVVLQDASVSNGILNGEFCTTVPRKNQNRRIFLSCVTLISNKTLLPCDTASLSSKWWFCCVLGK
jgi:hypothetical protein